MRHTNYSPTKLINLYCVLIISLFDICLHNVKTERVELQKETVATTLCTYCTVTNMSHFTELNAIKWSAHLRDREENKFENSY